MSEPEPLTVERVVDLVLANRVIRSPVYHADRTGIQWGADVVPALLGLFRVEADPRDDHPDGWVGFARGSRGETFRLDLDLNADRAWPDDVLVVTAMSWREGPNAGTLVDEVVGEIELPDEVPTNEEWEERARRYQSARRDGNGAGPAAVDAWLAALPGWKREVASRIDDVVRREVPDVRRDVKWHAPFYGVEGQGWFAQLGTFSTKLKLTFLRGTSLDPVPPVEIRNQEGRAIDLQEPDELDEAQLASWVRQAAALPGLWAS